MNMKNKILFSAIILFASAMTFNVNAQLKIAESGNVGIRLSNSTEPLSALSIDGAGFANAKIYVKHTPSSVVTTDQYGIYTYLSMGAMSSNMWQYGLYAQCTGAGGRKVGLYGMAFSSSNINPPMEAYGVFGIAGGASNGKNYGVGGKLQLSASAGAGVFGTNLDSLQVLSSRYAGYFRGNTAVNGTFYYTNMQATSDARLKTNIDDVKFEAVSQLKELHPVQFQWQQVEDVYVEDTITIKTPHFSSDIDFNKRHYGLIAQDVQKIFPELVEESGDGFLSVNYIELIPLLIQAVQDLSIEVGELKKQLTNKQ